MEEYEYRKQLIESLNKIKTEKTIQVELLRKSYVIKLTYDDIEYIVNISNDFKEIYEVDSKNHKLDVEELRIIIWNEFMCGRIDLN